MMTPDRMAGQAALAALRDEVLALARMLPGYAVDRRAGDGAAPGAMPGDAPDAAGRKAARLRDQQAAVEAGFDNMPV